MFQNQAPGTTFQNLPPDAIFYDYASDVYHEWHSLGVLHNILSVLRNILGVLRKILGVLHNILDVLHNVLGGLCNVLGVC